MTADAATARFLSCFMIFVETYAILKMDTMSCATITSHVSCNVFCVSLSLCVYMCSFRMSSSMLRCVFLCSYVPLTWSPGKIFGEIKICFDKFTVQ